MSAKGLSLFTITLLLMPIRLDAKQNDAAAVGAGRTASAQALTGLAPANDNANAKKAPDVVVDLSDIDAAATTRRNPIRSTESFAIANPTDGGFGTGPSVIDPLDVPIANTAEPSASWIRGSSVERWTRQPLAAAAISISLVLFGYGLMRMMGGRSSSRRPGRLPRQVIELVGFVPLSPRQQLQLVRLGSKLVLVAVSSNGAEPLAEVTDPVEVDQILAACQSGQSALASAIGRWTGRQLPREHGGVGERRGARALFEA